MGEGLVSCTVEELQQLERQLERSVNCIRARKVFLIKTRYFRLLLRKYDIQNLIFLILVHIQMQVFQEQIEKLKEKVDMAEVFSI